MKKDNEEPRLIKPLFDFEKIKKDEEEITKYRGEIITSTILFESMIDQVLTEYFCKSEVMSFFTQKVLWTEAITLDRKINIFIDIVKEVKGKEFNEFFKKYNVSVDLFKKVAVHRNKCAHVTYNSWIQFDKEDKYFGFLQNREDYKIDSQKAKNRIGACLQVIGIFLLSIQRPIEEIIKPKGK